MFSFCLLFLIVYPCIGSICSIVNGSISADQSQKTSFPLDSTSRESVTLSSNVLKNVPLKYSNTSSLTEIIWNTRSAFLRIWAKLRGLCFLSWSCFLFSVALHCFVLVDLDYYWRTFFPWTCDALILDLLLANENTRMQLFVFTHLFYYCLSFQLTTSHLIKWFLIK